MHSTLEGRPDAAGPHLESVLLWRAASEWFAVPLSAVAEVTPLAAITQNAGRSDDDVLGWLDLRGESVPVLDTHRAVAVDKPSAAATDRFVVLVVNGQRIALSVQEVAGIARVAASDTSHPGTFRPARIDGDGDERLVQLVDPAEAFLPQRSLAPDA